MNKFMVLLEILFFVQMAAAQQGTPNPHGDNLKIICETCHTTDSWENIPGGKFDHEQTGFSLLGAHKAVQCSACHQSLFFNRVGVSCADCHTDIHKGELGIECENCHNSQSWENYREIFIQHNQTNFPLIGVHANLDCEACHINEQERQFTTLSVDCKGCHFQDYLATSNPPHQQAHFETDCQKCHLQVSRVWERASFEHPQTFPLVNAHNIECSNCHETGYINTSTECYSCHVIDYQNTSDPEHLSFGFPTTCENCHTTVIWHGAIFDHLAESGFAIDGAHTSIQCMDCHQNNQLTGIPHECEGCHLKDFNAALEPNHIQNNFSLDCLFCHNTSAWDPSTFNHATTDFPLIGAHINVNCSDCHILGYSQQLATDCFSCHDNDYFGVSDPSHDANDFSHDCLLCHTVNAFTPASFNHAGTEFPLTGAHINVNCTDCHTSGYNQQLATDCFSCHDNDYNGVSDPSHVDNDFSHDCLLCHTVNVWSPASFDHASTNFPLTGAHTSVNCADCHTSGYNQQLPSDCFSCHNNDYNGVSDPSHVANDFSHDCLICHSVNAWNPATFDHATTNFPLLGKHIPLNCTECHSGGYKNTPLLCVACHETAYNNTTDPNHTSSQFPTTCEDCHTENGWEPANWNHDSQYFPINSGSHRGEWDICADCHVNDADFSQFECIFCHEHSQSRMDDKHKEEKDYEFLSIKCYDCHPRGKGD